MLVNIRNANAATKREFVGCWHRKQERIVEQPERLNVGVFRRQRQHDAVEFPPRELLKQHLCLRLAQLKPQARILGLHARQDARQHIRRERRDDAELERSTENITMASEVDEIAGARICSARSATSSPTSVSAISFGRRSTSSTPISRSSSRTCMDSAG
jgi:hypothetical protein